MIRKEEKKKKGNELDESLGSEEVGKDEVVDVDPVHLGRGGSDSKDTNACLEHVHDARKMALFSFTVDASGTDGAGCETKVLIIFSNDWFFRQLFSRDRHPIIWSESNEIIASEGIGSIVEEDVLFGHALGPRVMVHELVERRVRESFVHIFHLSEAIEEDVGRACVNKDGYFVEETGAQDVVGALDVDLEDHGRLEHFSARHSKGGEVENAVHALDGLDNVRERADITSVELDALTVKLSDIVSGL